MHMWLCRMPRDDIQIIMDANGGPSGVMPCTTCMAMYSGINSLVAHFPMIMEYKRQSHMFCALATTHSLASYCKLFTQVSHRYHIYQNLSYLIHNERGKKFPLKTIKSRDLGGNIQVQMSIQQPEQIMYGLNFIHFSCNVIDRSET